MINVCRVLHKHLPDCPGASKSQIGARILTDQEIKLPKSGKLNQASVLWTTFNTKNTFFLLGASVFIKFVLYCLNGQVVIRTYVAPWCVNTVDFDVTHIDASTKYPEHHCQWVSLNPGHLPGFSNRGGANEYVHIAHIRSAKVKSLTDGAQGPFKGPGSSRDLDASHAT